MYTIYLIGQISLDPETYEWRKRVQKYFIDAGLMFEGDKKHLSTVSIISPTDSPFNTKVLKKAQNGKIENGMAANTYKTKGIGILPKKDMNYVYKSNFAIANLNQYSSEKPILGTYFELAWYLANPDKVVIGIFDGKPMDDKQAGHPFVQAAVTAWVKNDEEACKMADYYMDVR